MGLRSKATAVCSLVLIAIIFSSIPTQNVFAVNSEGNSSPHHILGKILAKNAVVVDNGNWYEFSFDAVGNDAGECPSCSFASSPSPWTFSGSAILTVTDAGNAGDQFEVFDNGISLGTTSDPGSSGDCGFIDPSVCLADSNFSHGAFTMGPGSHSITIKPTLSPFSLGDAFFKVSSISVSPVGGTGIPIDTTALLLVGVQSSTLWMVPALVIAGAGIGFISFKKSKRK